MTEQQINQIIRQNQEREKRLKDIQEGNFITTEVYKNFLKEQGYNLYAYSGEGKINWDRASDNFFLLRDGAKLNLKNSLILVGSPEEWGDEIVGGFCKNMVNNPFVKHIESDYTTFKIGTIVENKKANQLWFGQREEGYFRSELEKDLSKEWVKYLIKICPEFAEYQIGVCEQNKAIAEKQKEYVKGLVARTAAILKQQQNEMLTQNEEVIKKNEEIISTIKEVTEKSIQL